jgi:hypothetical protein
MDLGWHQGGWDAFRGTRGDLEERGVIGNGHLAFIVGYLVSAAQARSSCC